MTAVLPRRALNRATLARQLLLERSSLDPVAAVEHLVGLQAQTPQTWYVGLWSRLAGFDAGAVGTALQVPLDTWVGQAPAPAAVEDVVLRYLAAFGPATVRDVQTWCGLTRLAEVLDGLRDRLVRFLDEHGRELFDPPDAPRPDPDTPAPVRFLYDFDNLLLSHADRSRVAGDADFAGHGFGTGSQEQPSSVLVDGMVAATWKVTRARGSATLNVRPFRRLTSAEQSAVSAEGAALRAFLHPGDTPTLHVQRPPTR